MKKNAVPVRELDAIEQDFRDALARLQAGTPKNKDLKAAQRKGRLKINFSTVATEANHSRTLIALREGCRYPATRQLIFQAIEGRTEAPRTSSEVISALRTALAEERAMRHAAQAEVLEHFNQRQAAEEQARNWKRAHDQQLKRSSIREGENVLQFRERTESD